MAKKKLLPKTAYPIKAVFLGLDTSKHSSGAVLLVPEEDEDTGLFSGNYERIRMGVVKNDEQNLRRDYVKEALESTFEEDSDDVRWPLVVVAEDWTPGGSRMTFATIKAMGVGWGRWEAEIMRQAPKAIIVRYKPAEWRELAFGWRYPKGRDAVKLFAQNHIKKVWGFEVSEDIAEAGCIALAGTRSGEVAAALAKKPRRKVASKA